MSGFVFDWVGCDDVGLVGIYFVVSVEWWVVDWICGCYFYIIEWLYCGD